MASTLEQRAAREAKLDELHEKLTSAVEQLVTGDDWRDALAFAARFRSRSFNNTMLIWVQHQVAFEAGRVPEPFPTLVAGYRQWQALGRQVMKGQPGYMIFAPVTGRFATSTPSDSGSWRRLGPREKPKPGEVVRSRMVGARPAYVWDVSQTDGEPLPTTPAPVLLEGEAPAGLWDGLTAQIRAAGFEVVSVPDEMAIMGANGMTDYEARTVSVRENMPPAARVKTLAHDLLTAPIGPSGTGGGGGCSDDTPRGSRLGLSWRVLCWAHDHRSTGEGIVADWLELGSGPRDVKRLAVPVVGAVVAIDEVPGTALLDASGRPVVVVADFFRGMLASGASVSSLRSYGLALLRWWRFLAAVEVPWDRAGRVEAQDFVLWMRMVGPAGRPGGYAPATINHGLAVVKAFYADRIAAGQGPLVNPIPEAVHRDGRRVQAHHNPMQPFAPGPRAPLRQRVPERVPRSIPDGLFDALFATVRSDRDRALLAFWVSTGARAAELLGASLDRIEPGEQRIGVHRKGSRRLQWLPASADAFVWWRLYEARVARPSGERALWLTNRSPVRPLTYPAARRMLQRANDALGTRWTLHDLRHTAAQRMIDDPHLSLTDVQWVLGHAHLTTTQLYLRARPDEVIAKVLEHHRTRAERPPAPLVPPGADGYPADVLEVLLGGGRRG